MIAVPKGVCGMVFTTMDMLDGGKLKQDSEIFIINGIVVTE